MFIFLIFICDSVINIYNRDTKKIYLKNNVKSRKRKITYHFLINEKNRI